MAANPMTQFEVYRIGPEIKIGTFDISFTNASLFMVVSSLAILIIFNLGSKKNSIIPDKIQLLAELSYTFVSKMISDTAGSKAKPYFAFIFSLFMFVLFSNMFGMIPYTFTVTSHIIVTFVLAAFLFIGVTIIGFILDKTFGTKPWLILIFFFVGVIAGITNVIKSAKNMQK